MFITRSFTACLFVEYRSTRRSRSSTSSGNDRSVAATAGCNVDCSSVRTGIQRLEQTTITNSRPDAVDACKARNLPTLAYTYPSRPSSTSTCTISPRWVRRTASSRSDPSDTSINAVARTDAATRRHQVNLKSIRGRTIAMWSGRVQTGAGATDSNSQGRPLADLSIWSFPRSRLGAEFTIWRAG
jgi:hypothetical protein